MELIEVDDVGPLVRFAVNRYLIKLAPMSMLNWLRYVGITVHEQKHKGGTVRLFSAALVLPFFCHLSLAMSM